MAIVNLTVNGMTCGHCEARVAKALQEVAGVSKVEVVLNANAALVEGEEVITADLVKAVIDAGYRAEVAE